MFEHSTPVPRLYRSAAKITEKVTKSKDSVKNLVYETKHPNTKALYALVVETLKHNKQLEFLLKRAKLFELEPRFNPWLAKVLITELLWGKRRLAGESKPIKTILAYQQILNAHVSDVLENKTTINKVTRPRFVRINTILITVKDAIDIFRDEGWTLVQNFDKSYDNFIKRISTLSENEFMVDIHIAELLIFPPNTEFYAHQGYRNGFIILQDKASCLPAHLLNPTPGSTILDMCAAPGMKTSHLAAKLNNEGKVYAVDLDTKRLKTLENLMERTGVTCVETINKDILKITSSDCQDVEYILVDPSCSGSGIVDRIDITAPTGRDNERIQKLRGFQIMILKHALRRFPKAKRIVYSTCSIYPEENEDVVQEVLSQTTHFKLVNAFDLLKGPWVNFGSEKYDKIGNFCLYSKTDTDMTNGFFVAVFERLEEGEENKYFVQNTEFKNVKCEKNALINNQPDNVNEFNTDYEINAELSKKNKKKKNEKLKGQISMQSVCEVTNDVGNGENNKISNINSKSNKKKKHKKNPDLRNSKESTDGLELKRNEQEELHNDYEFRAEVPKKSKKKKNKNASDVESGAANYNNVNSNENNSDSTNILPRKTKKKRNKKELDNENEVKEEVHRKGDKKTKKKKKCAELLSNDLNVNGVEGDIESNKVNNLEKNKKRKHRKNIDLNVDEETSSQNAKDHQRTVKEGKQKIYLHHQDSEKNTHSSFQQKKRKGEHRNDEFNEIIDGVKKSKIKKKRNNQEGLHSSPSKENIAEDEILTQETNIYETSIRYSTDNTQKKVDINNSSYFDKNFINVKKNKLKLTDDHETERKMKHDLEKVKQDVGDYPKKKKLKHNTNENC